MQKTKKQKKKQKNNIETELKDRASYIVYKRKTILFWHCKKSSKFKNLITFVKKKLYLSKPPEIRLCSSNS